MVGQELKQRPALSGEAAGKNNGDNLSRLLVDSFQSSDGGAQRVELRKEVLGRLTMCAADANRLLDLGMNLPDDVRDKTAQSLPASLVVGVLRIKNHRALGLACSGHQRYPVLRERCHVRQESGPNELRGLAAVKLAKGGDFLAVGVSGRQSGVNDSFGQE